MDLTGGYVPVVFLNRRKADQIMSTIRHNRARGTHAVLKMADIVQTLKNDHHLTDQEIERRLGMEDEEIDRLYDVRGMPARATDEHAQFNPGWEPAPGETNDQRD